MTNSKKMEDDLNYFFLNQNDKLKKNGRRPQKKMEDNINKKMEDDQKNGKKWKTTSNTM